MMMTRLVAVMVTGVAALTFATQGQAHCGACAADAQTTKALCPANCEMACCSAESAQLTKAQFKVDGMTCPACEAKVTAALAAIDGVQKPSASSEDGVAKLTYDPKKVNSTQLLAAIQKTGFKVQGEYLDVKVDGLKGAGCSTKLSGTLTSLNGVKEQKVCHESHHAWVTFDPQKITRKDLIAAIDETGYKVVE